MLGLKTIALKQRGEFLSSDQLTLDVEIDVIGRLPSVRVGNDTDVAATVGRLGEADE